jgi:ribosome-associated protein
MNRKTRTTHASADLVNDDDGLDQNGYDRPSKSQLKREMLALQALGAELTALGKDTLAKMPMPEDLAAAVHAARRITDHEGKRRQMQYVGRVMRGLREDEVAALRTAIDASKGVDKAGTARLHWIEHTREQLLTRDTALTEFLRSHPQADAQQGHTLIRNARREAEQNKPPRYFRELFQWIKSASGSATAADAAQRNRGHTDDDDDPT